MKNNVEDIQLYPCEEMPDDTNRIQKAIETACRNGCRVVIHRGNYNVGTVNLYSRTQLVLLKGCRIVGSDETEKYTVKEYCHQSKKNYWQSIFFAKNADGISVTGEGQIEGQGERFPYGLEAFSADDKESCPVNEYKIRPSLFYFKNCSNIEIKNIILRDAAQFAVLIEESEDIVVSGVEIYNRKNYNTDGLHFSENKRIHIDGCKLDCGDDAIVLNRYAQDVRISRCVISSRWAGVRIGPFSDGRFEDIEISDCKIHHTYGCGIKIQMGQGGIIRNVWVHRIRMEKVTGPVHIRLCHFPGWEECYERNSPGRIEEILIEDMEAEVVSSPSPGEHEVPVEMGEHYSCVHIQGVKEQKIRKVRWANCNIVYEGGYMEDSYQPHLTEEIDNRYPEYFLYGIMPCYAMYAAYVEELELENVHFSLKKPDIRVPFIMDQVDVSKWNHVVAKGAGDESV